MHVYDDGLSGIGLDVSDIICCEELTCRRTDRVGDLIDERILMEVLQRFTLDDDAVEPTYRRESTREVNHILKLGLVHRGDAEREDIAEPDGIHFGCCVCQEVRYLRQFFRTVRQHNRVLVDIAHEAFNRFLVKIDHIDVCLGRECAYEVDNVGLLRYTVLCEHFDINGSTIFAYFDNLLILHRRVCHVRQGRSIVRQGNGVVEFVLIEVREERTVDSYTCEVGIVATRDLKEDGVHTLVLVLSDDSHLGVVLRRVNLNLLVRIAVEGRIYFYRRVGFRAVRQNNGVVIRARLELNHRLTAQGDGDQRIDVRTLHLIGDGIEVLATVLRLNREVVDSMESFFDNRCLHFLVFVTLFIGQLVSLTNAHRQDVRVAEAIRAEALDIVLLTDDREALEYIDIGEGVFEANFILALRTVLCDDGDDSCEAILRLRYGLNRFALHRGDERQLTNAYLQRINILVDSIGEVSQCHTVDTDRLELRVVGLGTLEEQRIFVLRCAVFSRNDDGLHDTFRTIHAGDLNALCIFLQFSRDIRQRVRRENRDNVVIVLLAEVETLFVSGHRRIVEEDVLKISVVGLNSLPDFNLVLTNSNAVLCRYLQRLDDGALSIGRFGYFNRLERIAERVVNFHLVAHNLH